VSRTGAGEIGNLAADPGQRKTAFEQARDLLVERGDRQHRRRGVAGIGGEAGLHRVGLRRAIHKFGNGDAYVTNQAEFQALSCKYMILKRKPSCIIFAQKLKSLTDQGLWRNSCYLLTKLSTVPVCKTRRWAMIFCLFFTQEENFLMESNTLHSVNAIAHNLIHNLCEEMANAGNLLGQIS
jgi:hypothetical protein